jgi:hypothetical protein
MRVVFCIAHAHVPTPSRAPDVASLHLAASPAVVAGELELALSSPAGLPSSSSSSSGSGRSPSSHSSSVSSPTASVDGHDVEDKPDIGISVEAEAGLRRADAKFQAGTQVESKVEAVAEIVDEVETKARPEVEAKPEVASMIQTQVKPEVKMEAKAAVESNPAIVLPGSIGQESRLPVSIASADVCGREELAGRLLPNAANIDALPQGDGAVPPQAETRLHRPRRLLLVASHSSLPKVARSADQSETKGSYPQVEEEVLPGVRVIFMAPPPLCSAGEGGMGRG